MNSKIRDLNGRLLRDGIRYKNSADQQGRLRRELEEQVAEARQNNDLDLLRKLDLKEVAKVNAGNGKSSSVLSDDDQIQNLTHTLVAMRIQSAFRGKKDRENVKKVAEKRRQEERQPSKGASASKKSVRFDEA